MRTLIVIPTLNESANVAEVIRQLRSLDDAPDVLIVDDSSPDGTADIVAEISKAEPAVKLIRRELPRNFSQSYIDGFRYALENGYDAVVCMDADLSHNPAEVPDLIGGLERADFAIGSRYLPGKIRITGWPLHRLILSRTSSAYVRLITGVHIYDPMAGFKAIKRQALEKLDLDGIVSQGYSFSAEILYRLSKKGVSVTEVPVSFVDRKRGQSKMSFRRIREAMVLPFRLRFFLKC